MRHGNHPKTIKIIFLVESVNGARRYRWKRDGCSLIAAGNAWSWPRDLRIRCAILGTSVALLCRTSRGASSISQRISSARVFLAHVIHSWNGCIARVVIEVPIQESRECRFASIMNARAIVTAFSRARTHLTSSVARVSYFENRRMVVTSWVNILNPGSAVQSAVRSPCLIISVWS